MPNQLRQLRQLRHLTREIELLQEQIRKVETKIVSDVVTGSDVEFPHMVHSITITGLDQRVSRLRRRLQRKCRELIRMRADTLEYIATLPESHMRQILILRYVEGLSWPQIAERLGGTGDGSTERKKHDRYLGFRGS